MTKSHDLDCGHTHGQEEGEAVSTEGCRPETAPVAASALPAPKALAELILASTHAYAAWTTRLEASEPTPDFAVSMEALRSAAFRAHATLKTITQNGE